MRWVEEEEEEEEGGGGGWKALDRGELSGGREADFITSECLSLLLRSSLMGITWIVLARCTFLSVTMCVCVCVHVDNVCVCVGQ